MKIGTKFTFIASSAVVLVPYLIFDIPLISCKTSRISLLKRIIFHLISPIVASTKIDTTSLMYHTDCKNHPADHHLLT